MVRFFNFSVIVEFVTFNNVAIFLVLINNSIFSTYIEKLSVKKSVANVDRVLIRSQWLPNKLILRNRLPLRFIFTKGQLNYSRRILNILSF